MLRFLGISVSLRLLGAAFGVPAVLAGAVLSGCSSSGSAAAEPTGAGGSAGTGGSSGGTAGSGGAATPVLDAAAPVAPGTWVNLYYPGWTQNSVTVSHIDFGAVTQIIHFALVPTVVEGGTGVTLDDSLNSADAASAKELIDAAHAAGKRVLISIGGAGRGSRDFAAAVADPGFIPLLISTTLERGYDGIDIDAETRTLGVGPFQAFSRELRRQMTETAPALRLTTAVLGAAALTYGPIADVYDEINIMSYDFVYGPNQTWFDSPISGGSGQFYSIDRAVREFVAAGVPKEKLGIGLKFSGFAYPDVTEPRQTFTTRPSSVSYNLVMTEYYSDAAYHWDETAQAPYLSVTSPVRAFVTYENERSIRAKFDFLRAGPYGGIILWDASGAFVARNPVGQQLPLMEAVKQSAGGML